MTKLRTFSILISFVLLSSCSAEYHISKALKKDPSILDTLRITTVLPMEVPPIQNQFDCVELMKGNAIELYSPVIYTNPVTGATKTDSVRTTFQAKTDSVGNPTPIIQMEVDCPDVEVVKEEVIVTLPPEQPSFWFKLQWMSIGAVLMVVGIVILKLKG